MRRQPASFLAEKPDMLMLKCLAFGWFGVNAIVKLKLFGFFLLIDIVVLVEKKLNPRFFNPKLQPRTFEPLIFQPRTF
jgi:hypothetical protein